MENLGAISYTIAAVAFAVLGVLLATHFKRNTQLVFLAVAVAISVIWASIAAFLYSEVYTDSLILEIIETLRNIAWLMFLQLLLLRGTKNTNAYRLLSKLFIAIYGFYFLVAILLIYFLYNPALLVSGGGYDYRAVSHLIMAAIGLFLVEQLLRHIDPDQRWTIKYLCFGLGGMFTYEFYLYADALLLKHIDPEIWMARGIINALIVPFIAVSAARNPQLSLNIFVSHRFAFHTTALLAGGLYLLAMGLGGYYIKLYGGAWGSMLQVVFLFGAAIIFASLIFSGSIRASLRVFLGKHFFRYRYDYREEWLRITETLSGKQEPEDLRSNALRAIADIVESPTGLLWINQENDSYDLAVSWNISETKSTHISADEALIEYLKQTHWIIDIDEYKLNPGVYNGLELPRWLLDVHEAWLIVPVIHQTQLLGFALLSHARTKFPLNWEVRDILRTAGRQVAGYLALLEVNIALASARQFEAFNRLSAFVVHDLKNIVAQLSLLERNAADHKDNPEFFDDAITTVGNATNKMNRLLAQLRTQQSISKNITRVNLPEVIDQVIKLRSAGKPVPEFNGPEFTGSVLTDKDRLISVIEHLVQNAQEATESDGFVQLRIYSDERYVNLEIEDNGTGMDEEFIRTKLFKPFVTTKGNAGMGIGVYEAREFLRAFGGSIEVKSKPGRGTTFTLSMPVSDQRTH